MLTLRAFRMSTLRLAVIFAAASLFSISNCDAERVGYSFRGNLTPFVSTYRLFSTNVPGDSPITGTFSYDTSAPGAPADEGGKKFHQSIHGGFTLNVLNASSTAYLLQLATHEYRITVVDDAAESPPDLIDYLRVEFDKAFTPTPPPIWVNGAPYTGSTAQLNTSLSWASPTFNGPSEPALHTDLPLQSLVDSGGTARTGVAAPFVITSVSRIVPSPGDLNFDGKVNISDYFEWRKAFGGDAQSYAYADANTDGHIDGADYILWRKAAAEAAAVDSSQLPTIPEPTTFAITLVAVVLSRLLFRRR